MEIFLDLRDFQIEFKVIIKKNHQSILDIDF